MTADPHTLTTVDAVRAIIGPESAAVRVKVFDRLDATSRTFVARSPMILLSTASADGTPDVSPKGDGPGFVLAVDDHTLLIPERKGNRMILGLQNLLANPRVALLFLIPGVEETLRVHGRAELTADPALLQRLRAREQPALLAIRVQIERCFFHCAKAFRRSKLWRQEAWPEPVKVSFGKLLAPRLGGGADLEQQIDAAIDEDYRSNL
jgi:PPOX class probable FMN-dependent enzyme